MRLHFLETTFALLLLAPFPVTATEVPGKPWETAAFNVETGLLWEAGHNTPLSYRLVPTQFSWRSHAMFGRVFEDGSRLVVRHRFTLLTTWIQQGPESHYIAAD